MAPSLAFLSEIESYYREDTCRLFFLERATASGMSSASRRCRKVCPMHLILNPVSWPVHEKFGTWHVKQEATWR